MEEPLNPITAAVCQFFFYFGQAILKKYFQIVLPCELIIILLNSSVIAAWST